MCYQRVFASKKQLKHVWLTRKIVDISMHIVQIKFIRNVHEEMQCQNLRGRRANNMKQTKTSFVIFL